LVPALAPSPSQLVISAKVGASRIRNDYFVTRTEKMTSECLRHGTGANATYSHACSRICPDIQSISGDELTSNRFYTKPGLNAESGSYSSRGFFTSACDDLNGFPRVSDDFPRSGSGRAALERRFRRIFQIELIARAASQRSVDACRDARSGYVAPVHDHAFCNRLRPEEG
jgi:hypothetical protein